MTKALILFLLLGLVLLLFLFYWAVSAVPIIIQFFLAYVLAKRLAKGKRWQTIGYVAAILLTFTLVLRAGSLWSDLSFKWVDGKRQIYRQLALNEGDRIVVDVNAVDIVYKPEYATAPVIGAGGDYKFRWGGVDLRRDYFGNTLADTSLTLDVNAEHSNDMPKVEIRINPDVNYPGTFYQNVYVRISDQNGIAAVYTIRTRLRFPGDPEYSKERLSGGHGSWSIPFLLHSTPVNWFLVQPLTSWIGLAIRESPISQFLAAAIDVSIPRKPEPDKNVRAQLVAFVEGAMAKWQGRLKLDASRTPIISCQNNTLRAEGLNPITIWNQDGSMRRVYLARKETFAPLVSLVVCGTAGYSVVAKGLRDGRAWIYKYDHDWNLLGRVEITNVVLWEKLVSQVKEESQYYRLDMYDKAGALLTYHIPKSKSESLGFADRSGDGYTYNALKEYSEYYHPRPRDSLEGFLLKRIKEK